MVGVVERGLRALAAALAGAAVAVPARPAEPARSARPAGRPAGAGHGRRARRGWLAGGGGLVRGPRCRREPALGIRPARAGTRPRLPARGPRADGTAGGGEQRRSEVRLSRPPHRPRSAPALAGRAALLARAAPAARGAGVVPRLARGASPRPPPAVPIPLRRGLPRAAGLQRADLRPGPGPGPPVRHRRCRRAGRLTGLLSVGAGGGTWGAWDEWGAGWACGGHPPWSDTCRYGGVRGGGRPGAAGGAAPPARLRFLTGPLVPHRAGSGRPRSTLRDSSVELRVRHVMRCRALPAPNPGL
ncbi:putative Glycerate kinase [Frankia sp. Hr75.2]|nr:putative Glycerate kinase [Frankia sp. Hr75.2]